MSNDSLYSAPPAGVTFALPDLDFPIELKRQIADKLLDAAWNRYPTATASRAIESFAGVLGLPPKSVSLFRGADEAIARLVETVVPRTLVCPAFGFPGYTRAAGAVCAKVIEYQPAGDLSDAEPLEADDRDLMIVVCWPGNPIGNASQIERLIRMSPMASTALVDLTYLYPFGPEFAALARRLVDAGIAVAFSFSKSLGLAGARLGGLLLPDGPVARPTHNVTFPWDMFQILVLDAVMDPANRGLLTRHHHEQHELRSRLVSILESSGARVLDAASPNFVSIADNVAFRKDLDIDEKRYPALGVRRVDASLRNLLVLGA